MSDPEKRYFIIEEFLKTKQNVKKTFLSERIDESNTQY